MQLCEQLLRALRLEALRREVQQLGLRVLRLQIALELRTLVRRHRRVHRHGLDADILQRLDLVHGQRDKRCDHNRDTNRHDGGNLEDEALARARGQHDQ